MKPCSRNQCPQLTRYRIVMFFSHLINRRVTLAAVLAASSILCMRETSVAATVSASMSVSATVEATCTVAAPSFSPGTYNPRLVNELITGDVQCNRGTRYSARTETHHAGDDETMGAWRADSTRDVTLSSDGKTSFVTETIIF